MATTKEKSPSVFLTLKGTLPKIKPENAVRLAAYLVQGNNIIARAPVGADGQFQMSVNRSVLTAKSNYATEAVIGPAGMKQTLEPSLNLQRVALNAAALERGKIPLEKLDLSEAVLKIWWFWCWPYCVSGTVVGPDGCPVPGAQVTVSTVANASAGGYSVTSQATVQADSSGNFNACFEWCRSFCSWPCDPFWWLCWPWWWDWDILHVLEQIEAGPSLPLKQPASADLMVGQGFTAARPLGQRLVPDAARTNLISRKLSDPRIRALFPWRWWCCENPSIIFTVSQGPNVILQETPAANTRWCFPNNSVVTLVGNDETISACPGGPPPAEGFIWTLVGDNTLAPTIVDGYAPGSPGTNESDLAFNGLLYIYGDFAIGSGVAYFQVFNAQWTGNPAQGATAPVGPGTAIGTDLYNQAFVEQGGVITPVPVKMGPFSKGALTNLYATAEARAAMPAGLLPPFPPGTFFGWAKTDLRVTADASSLIPGNSVGAVTLTLGGFDTSFNPVMLPANTDDALTLAIDTTGLTAQINGLNAFTATAPLPPSSGSSQVCQPIDVGPGGYVVLNVTVSDVNGNLCQYQLVPDYGHASTGTCIPDVRGYATPVPFVPTPAPGPYQQPVVAQKTFVGGTENITFFPPVSCCYDFRLNVIKRVTDGTNVSSVYTADFWTAQISID